MSEDEYKEKIIELVENINNAEFVEFLYKLINSLKKKWGV